MIQREADPLQEDVVDKAALAGLLDNLEDAPPVLCYAKRSDGCLAPDGSIAGAVQKEQGLQAQVFPKEANRTRLVPN